MTRCHICKRILDNPDDPFSIDCGGDCLRCMAWAGDPDAIEKLTAIQEEL